MRRCSTRSRSGSFCTVSSPDEEGRPFAEHARREGLAVDLVADEDSAHALGTVDVLVLGTDPVFADGSAREQGRDDPLAEEAKTAPASR